MLQRAFRIHGKFQLEVASEVPASPAFAHFLENGTGLLGGLELRHGVDIVRRLVFTGAAGNRWQGVGGDLAVVFRRLLIN